MKTAIPYRIARAFRRARRALLVASVFIFSLTGCHSPGGPDGRMPPGGSPSQPKLAAQTTFLAGTLVADLTLEPLAGGRGGPGDGKAGGGHHRPPSGGPSGGGMGGGMGGGPGGGPPGGGGGRGEAADDDAPSQRTPSVSVARIALHLTLTNTGKEALTFAVADVISELGNFAIRPERMSLAPGQSAAIDPLGSVFPAQLSELTVEVRVRHAGHTETQTVRLVPVAQDAANHDRP